jgi:hypothetical protein
MVQQPFDEGDPSQSHPIRTKSHGSEADPRPSVNTSLPGEFPGDWGGPVTSNYIGNIHHHFEIFANQNVQQFGIRVDTFDTEGFYDYLQFGPILAGPWTTLTGTGYPAGTWYDFAAPSGSSFQSFPGLMLFRTDDSVTRPGFTTGMARVCCGGTPNNATSQLYEMTRGRGVLLGTNDTVYMNMDYTCAEAAEHQTIALRGPSGTDFDLYARCGALPTPTSYISPAGMSSNSQEFYHLPANACSCPNTLYIAVNSYQGSGTFDIVRSSHIAGRHVTLRAGTRETATPAQMATFATMLRQSAGRLYGATALVRR